jgi:hypothetical protein
MGEFPRKADGRRVFTPEFKRRVVQQILKGKKTLAELSREFDIYPTVLRSWKRHYEAGASGVGWACVLYAERRPLGWPAGSRPPSASCPAAPSVETHPWGPPFLPSQDSPICV